MVTNDEVNPEWRRDALFKSLCLEACASALVKEALERMSPEDKIAEGLGYLISYNIPSSVYMLEALHTALEDQNFHAVAMVVRALQDPKKRIALVSLAISLEEDPDHRAHMEKFFGMKEPVRENKD